MVKQKSEISDIDISCLMWEIYKRLGRGRQRFLDGYGLTSSQMEVLGALHVNSIESPEEELTQINISHKTFIDPMTISTIIKNLEKKDLIYRTPSRTDSRALSVNLSEKGLALSEEVSSEVEMYKTDLMENIDKGALHKQLTILLENIKKYNFIKSE